MATLTWLSAFTLRCFTAFHSHLSRLAQAAAPANNGHGYNEGWGGRGWTGVWWGWWWWIWIIIFFFIIVAAIGGGGNQRGRDTSRLGAPGPAPNDTYYNGWAWNLGWIWLLVIFIILIVIFGGGHWWYGGGGGYY